MELEKPYRTRPNMRVSFSSPISYMFWTSGEYLIRARSNQPLRGFCWKLQKYRKPAIFPSPTLFFLLLLDQPVLAPGHGAKVEDGPVDTL